MFRMTWTLTLGTVGLALICLTGCGSATAEGPKTGGPSSPLKETKTVRGPTVIVEGNFLPGSEATGTQTARPSLG
jgi:hypothetical protein